MSQVSMIAEQQVPIKKRFSGDVFQYPKYKDWVKREAIKGDLDIESIYWLYMS